jgi:DNA-binding MarR family transcriptional regulator
MRLTDLANLEQVKPPTMTKIVAGLEAAGLVRRGADRGDARARRIQATPRGVRLLQKGRRRRVERLARALAALGPRDIEVLRAAARLVEQIVPRL